VTNNKKVPFFEFLLIYTPNHYNDYTTTKVFIIHIKWDTIYTDLSTCLFIISVQKRLSLVDAVWPSIYDFYFQSTQNIK